MAPNIKVRTHAGLMRRLSLFRFEKFEERKLFEPWNEHDVKRLKQVIEEIENDHEINPHKKKIHRCKDDAVWLWIINQMWEDHSFAFLYAELHARLTTDVACDPNNETDESPDTPLFGMRDSVI